jgi:hypothetical protein
MLRDKKHLSWLATLPCSRCGSYGSCAAHIRVGGGGGTGIKPPDNECLPLCHDCHIGIQHRIGERSFYRDIDKAHDLAHALWLFSRHDFEALSVIAKMRREVFNV